MYMQVPSMHLEHIQKIATAADFLLSQFTNAEIIFSFDGNFEDSFL